MDIGNAKLAFGLSIKLFDDILKGLHSQNVFPQQVEVEEEINIVDKLKATIFLTVDIDQPDFYLEIEDAVEPELRFKISGKVTPKISFAGETSPDLFTIDFEAEVRLGIKLKNRINQAPVIVLDYGGAIFASDPFETKFIDSLFDTDEVKNTLNLLEFDVITPIIEGLGNIYYFGTPANLRPSVDQYPVSLQLQIPGSKTRSAIVLFIGTPGTSLNTQHLYTSIVPRYSEFMMHAGSEIVEHMKEKGKSKIEEFIKDFSSVVLSNYILTVENNQVDINAQITETETGAYATIDGYFHFRHVPGMEKMFMDGSKVNIDVELPWWLDVIAFFMPPIEDAIRFAKQEVPDIMQETITDLVNNFMNKLDESIQLEGLDIEGLPVEVYPQEIKLDNNSITANIQILTWPITEELLNASYGTLQDRFIYFELESGRKYFVEDLAKFMYKGLVNIPGYHQVDLKYLRANPDGRETNNLEYRFGR